MWLMLHSPLWLQSVWKVVRKANRGAEVYLVKRVGMGKTMRQRSANVEVDLHVVVGMRMVKRQRLDR